MIGLALALTLAPATALPVPTSTPHFIPTIITVRSRPDCQALTDFALPDGYIAGKNDDAFIAAETKFAGFLHNLADAAPQAKTPEIKANFVDPDTFGSDSPQQALSQQDRIDHALSMLSSTSTNEDSSVYDGSTVLSAAQTDRYLQQIYSNLKLADDYLNASWRKYPAGKDPHIDAMRQQAQNVIDLQHTLADRFQAIVGTYLDNRNVSLLQGSQSKQASFRDTLERTLEGQRATGASTGKQSPDFSNGDVEQAKNLGDIGELERVLRGQELRLSAEAVSTYDSCRS